MGIISRMISYDTLTFGTSYDVFLDKADNIPLGVSVSSRALKRGESSALPGALSRDVDTLMVTVSIKSSLEAAFTAFLVAFDETNKTLRKMVGTDEAGIIRYSMMCRVKTAPILKDGVYKVLMEVPDRIWKNETPITTNTSITVSGQTFDIAVGGSAKAQPIFQISPIHAKGAGGYDYLEYLAIVNPGSKNFVDYPFIFKTLNTSALVAAGKMQADGDDFRLVIDGKIVSRFLDGMNTTTTKIKGNLNLQPVVQMQLSGSIAGSGAITSIVCQPTAGISLTPTRGKLLIKTGANIEIFTYTSRYANTYTFDGVTRAQRFTSMSAHNDGDAVYFLEHDIYLMYGAPTAKAPLDDGKQPLLDSTSTNTSWVQNVFRAVNGLRTGQWRGARLSTLGGSLSQSKIYTATLGTYADPATEMGAKIASYTMAGVAKAETAELTWITYVPSGIINVLMTGKKRRTSASWPAVAMLEKSMDGVTWELVWNETTPASINTTLALATHNDALGASYYYLRWTFKGDVRAGGAAFMEIAACTLTLDSAGIPNVIFDSGEQSQYLMDGILELVTTGDQITLKGSLKLTDVITIDCDAREIYLQDGRPAWDFIDWNTAREAWMDVLPNRTNRFKYTEAGVDRVDITTIIAEKRKA